jgi:hypothetical protein
MPWQRRSTVRWLALVLAGWMVIGAPLGTPVAAQDDALTIPLGEYDDSGVSGTATLEAADGSTHVAMMLQGEAVTGEHPTHIHTGTCDDFDPDPTYPLTTVLLADVSNAGVSDTMVEDVALRELLRDDYVILVHKSADELTTYFVCGDIKQVAAVDEIPVAGVGVADVALPWAPLMGMLAALAAASSVALRLWRDAHSL